LKFNPPPARRSAAFCSPAESARDRRRQSRSLYACQQQSISLAADLDGSQFLPRHHSRGDYLLRLLEIGTLQRDGDQTRARRQVRQDLLHLDQHESAGAAQNTSTIPGLRRARVCAPDTPVLKPNSCRSTPRVPGYPFGRASDLRMLVIGLWPPNTKTQSKSVVSFNSKSGKSSLPREDCKECNLVAMELTPVWVKGALAIETDRVWSPTCFSGVDLYCLRPAERRPNTVQGSVKSGSAMTSAICLCSECQGPRRCDRKLCRLVRRSNPVRCQY